MKRCPTCNRTYTDDSQKFCLDDGATLLEESQQSFDPQATIAMPGGQAPPPASNPYGSGAGQGSFGSGAGQSSYGSGAGSGPGSYGSGAGQGSFGSGAGQGSYGSGAGQGGFGSGAGQGQQQTPSWSPSPPAYGASAPQKKKSILPWVLGGAAVLIVGAIGLVIAIVLIASSSSNSNNSNNSNSSRSNSNSNSNRSNSNSTASSGVPIISSDGKIRITAPSTWKTSTELNDKAELQASDSSNQMYLIVLTDPKANYRSMTIDDHSEETLGTLTRSMTSSTKTGPTNMTIDGSPALQYEVRGEIKGLNVVYLHTTVETSKNFHQIVAWTLQTTYDAKKDVLQDVVQSFKETSP